MSNASKVHRYDAKTVTLYILSAAAGVVIGSPLLALAWAIVRYIILPYFGACVNALVNS